MVQIRPESPDETAAVHALTARAFGRVAEADLNDLLRTQGKATLSLVAEEAGRIVGHAMFSPVLLDAEPRGVALGPISVEEACRRRGIARALIESGLATLRAEGWDFVMLLGSPRLYPRFGFVPGKTVGLRSDEDVPDDEFMVFELRTGALDGVSGVARFAPEFHEVD